MALMNKGNAFADLGRLDEAMAAHDAAIVILTELVERQGLAELANILSKALMNNTLVLEKLEQWDEAHSCLDKAIALQEGCVARGMGYLIGELLRMIRFRLTTDLDRERLGRSQSRRDPVSGLCASLPSRQPAARIHPR